MTERVFVSYSHHDALLVTPVVRLLRSTNDFVFQDSDNIKPGRKWREALGEAIEQANLVVVFWCLHSSESPEVEREYRSAIEARKDVLPVLLDSTPVPPALGEFQWIDFRELGRGRHPRPEARPTAQASPASPARWRWDGAVASAAVVVLMIGASLWVLRGSAPQVSSAPPPATTVEPGPTPGGAPTPPDATPAVVLPTAPMAVPSGGPSWVVIVVLLLVLGFIALVAMKGLRAVGPEKRTASRQDKVMAQALEEELRRRLRPGGT